MPFINSNHYSFLKNKAKYLLKEVFFVIIAFTIFFVAFYLLDSHSRKDEAQKYLCMGLSFVNSNLIIPYSRLYLLASIYKRNSSKALWPTNYENSVFITDIPDDKSTRFSKVKVSIYSVSECFPENKEIKIKDREAPAYALGDFISMQNSLDIKALHENSNIAKSIDNRILYFYTIKDFDEYKLIVNIYNSQDNQIEKRLIVPWEGLGIPKVLTGGNKIFLFYTNLKIVDLKDNSIITIVFNNTPWPYSVSEDGTTVVWVQKEDTRQRAVVYDVDKREVVSDIFLENYGGGVKSIAVQPHSSYLAVGYQRNLKTVPKVVIYNYEEKKAVKSLYLDKKGFYIK